jgi:hypothetical protein
MSFLHHAFSQDVCFLTSARSLGMWLLQYRRLPVLGSTCLLGISLTHPVTCRSAPIRHQAQLPHVAGAVRVGAVEGLLQESLAPPSCSPHARRACSASAPGCAPACGTCGTVRPTRASLAMIPASLHRTAPADEGYSPPCCSIKQAQDPISREGRSGQSPMASICAAVWSLCP